MDGSTLAALITVVGAAAVALASFAFRYPTIYVERISPAMIGTPLLIAVARGLWLWGFVAAGGDPGDLRIETALIVLAALVAVLLRWIAHISPNRVRRLD